MGERHVPDKRLVKLSAVIGPRLEACALASAAEEHRAARVTCRAYLQRLCVNEMPHGPEDVLFDVDAHGRGLLLSMRRSQAKCPWKALQPTWTVSPHLSRRCTAAHIPTPFMLVYLRRMTSTTYTIHTCSYETAIHATPPFPAGHARARIHPAFRRCV